MLFLTTLFLIQPLSASFTSSSRYPLRRSLTSSIIIPEHSFIFSVDGFGKYSIACLLRCKLSMNLQKIKESIVRAGRQLAASGLIARTWGNVSCRVSNTQFAITPSGRLYTNLTTADIVVVNTADGIYEGGIKPSSEKGVHAAVYRRRRDINFIIHTHQVNASVASVLGMDLDTPDTLVPLLGERIICAAYGLPGSKALQYNVVAALERSAGGRFSWPITAPFASAGAMRKLRGIRPGRGLRRLDRAPLSGGQ